MKGQRSSTKLRYAGPCQAAARLWILFVLTHRSHCGHDLTYVFKLLFGLQNSNMEKGLQGWGSYLRIQSGNRTPPRYFWMTLIGAKSKGSVLFPPPYFSASFECPSLSGLAGSQEAKEKHSVCKAESGELRDEIKHKSKSNIGGLRKYE